MYFIKRALTAIIDFFTTYQPAPTSRKVGRRPKTGGFGVKKAAAIVAAVTVGAIIPAAVSANGVFTTASIGKVEPEVGTLLIEEIKNPDNSVTITSVISAEKTESAEETYVPAYQPESAPESTEQGAVANAQDAESQESAQPAPTDALSAYPDGVVAPGYLAQSFIPAQGAELVATAEQPQAGQSGAVITESITPPSNSETQNATQTSNAASPAETGISESGQTTAPAPLPESVQNQPQANQTGAANGAVYVPEQSSQIKQLIPEAVNADIKELQQRLMDLGYMDNDEPTEYYGPATQQAVRYFQRKHGLVNDGFAGEQTQAILFSDAAQPYSVTLGADGPDVERIQERLAELGYPVSATGYFGTETDYAVRYFQRMNGLIDDGSVGHDTKEILYSASAEPALEQKTEKKTESNKTDGKASGAAKPQSGEGGSSGGQEKVKDTTSYTSNPGSVEAFISAAMAQVGKPYVLGGKGPNVFDCSGFVYYALKMSGNGISYMTSGGWANSGFATVGSVEDLQRGDIICMTGHVGIYLGGGQMVDASSSRGEIVVREVGAWARRNFKCGKRPL